MNQNLKEVPHEENLSVGHVACNNIGCATTQMVRPTIQDTDVIHASFNKVWGAVVATLAEMALPIESIERGSGLVTTKFVTFDSGLIADKQIDPIAQRPSIFLGIWSQGGRYTLSIFVTSSGENTTKIKITTYIEEFENNVTKSWHACYSKGVIEKQIFDSVRSKI